jgi:hypothetical protein
MVDVLAVSMVGGTIFIIVTIFPRWVIQREISRVLVLNLSGKKAVQKHRQDIFVLDTAFALIEGHPQPWWLLQIKGRATSPNPVT